MLLRLRYADATPPFFDAASGLSHARHAPIYFHGALCYDFA